jgi:two-component system sensor histidine kinase UhpB
VAGLLTQDQELHLYRIVQEALSNVARHADARRISVRVARQRHRVVVWVADDGRGFDVATARGFGLVTMRERAEILGAQLTVRAVQGRGTQIRVALPLAPAGTV